MSLITKSWEERLWEGWLCVCPALVFLQHLQLLVVRNRMWTERTVGLILYGHSCVAILDCSNDVWLKYLPLRV